MCTLSILVIEGIIFGYFIGDRIGGHGMEKLFEKLKEYLNMETEISFEEFSNYYKDLIQTLTTTFEEMDQDARLKARYACSIVQANAESRLKRDKKNAKAYRKIMEKTAFWSNAINYHLLKDGMQQSEIDEATEAINDSI